jgi:hypothetical protein
MTVKELIEELQKFPQDTTVLLYTGATGYSYPVVEKDPKGRFVEIVDGYAPPEEIFK